MFDFKFASMKFDFNEPCDDNYDFKFPDDEVNWYCEEIDAHCNFPSSDLDHDKICSQICISKTNKVNTLSLKNDNLNKNETSNHMNEELNDNKVNIVNNEYVKEKKKDQCATVCTPHIKIEDFPIDEDKNLSIKEDIVYTSREVNDEDSFEDLKEIINNRKKQKGGNKQSRFGRNDDREMFMILKELCASHERDISDFCTTDLKSDLVLQKILIEVHQQTKFRGDKISLFKRIKKLSCRQKFSVRENKLFIKLIQLQLKSNKLDFNQIEYFFPGKSSNVLRKKIGKHLSSL